MENSDEKPKFVGKVGDGTPGPGRPKGLKNQKTLWAVERTLAEKGVDPVSEVLRLIPELKPVDQLTAWALLFKYCYTPPVARPVEDSQLIQINYIKPENQ